MQSRLPAVALAILNSLVQLLGVLVWGWPIGNIFLLLWVENAIVTVVAIVRLTQVPEPGGKVLASVNLLIFCFVHGVFSIALAGMTGLELSRNWFVFPLLLLIVRYAVEVVGSFARFERPQTVAQGIGFAMRRIVMLHLIIIASWFVMIGGLVAGSRNQATDPSILPLVALAVLLVIKTIAEVRAVGVGPNVESKWKFQSS